ncbi:hypothetical protein TNCV_2495711 [Trichonephila clavipes]|nr:hypothetical protein TNCV_2495711 [Trichonephila clavipes]
MNTVIRLMKQKMGCEDYGHLQLQNSFIEKLQRALGTLQRKRNVACCNTSSPFRLTVLMTRVRIRSDVLSYAIVPHIVMVGNCTKDRSTDAARLDLPPRQCHSYTATINGHLEK